MSSEICKLEIDAQSLLCILDVVVPPTRKKKKPKTPVSIRFDSQFNLFEISEARHGLRTHNAPAKGQWTDEIQVDGQMLRQFVEKCGSSDQLVLRANDEHFTIELGKSKVTFKRLDGPGGRKIKHSAPKPQKSSNDPVKAIPEDLGKRVELDDTWGFSARVPMPQHRDDYKEIPRKD